MRDKIIKHMAVTFSVLGIFFINTQNAKADTMLAFDKGTVLYGIQPKQAEIINETSDNAEISDNGDKASRGDISKGNEVVNYAYKFLGKPYVYGASGPNAFDCSGLTQYVYNRFGGGLSRTTYSQVNQGIKVSKGDLIAGDLVFFNTAGSISHVGIYIGNGEFIHAPRTGKPVMVSSMSDGYYSERYVTARRIFS